MMQLRTFSPRFLVLLASLIVAATARVAAADTITLMWDPNPETDVIGYIVHVGTQAGAYTQHVDVGLQTGYAFQTAVAGQQYCFAVSAYFAGPVEGPSSNEVCGFSNRPPTLVNPGARSGQVSQATTLQLQGADPDGQPVTYSATGLPAGITLQSSTGFISGTPTTAGSFTVTATVSDGVLTASQTFTWTVTNNTDTTPPAVVITGPTSAATYSTAGTTVTLSGTATDNAGVLQVAWVNNRGGSGTATGTSSWSAGSIALQTGANVLTVTARDAAGNTASDVLTVTVNGAPVLTNPGSPSSAVAQATSLQLSAADPNGDPLTYSATGLPPGFSVTAANGLIAGTPVLTGSYPVTATVSDGALSATQSFTWTITPNASSTGTIRLMWDPNTESGIAGYIVHAGIQSGVYLQHYDVGLTTTYLFANAVQGQRYCFAVSAYVAGPVEGPRSAEVCGYANEAPTLASVSNQTSNAGQAATLQLAGSDPEGSPLTYSATGLPAGLSVAPGTGLISGTPTTAGAYSVVASVSDGPLTASRPFTWTVIAIDTTAPVVTITVPTSAATYATTTATLTLGGSASDAVGVTQVSWTNNRGGSGVAIGTSTWNAPSIALVGGQNVITVTARDAAGNTATTVLTVTRNAAPTLAAIADQTTEAGTFASLQLVGSDVDGDLLTYGAYGLPPGMTLVVSTGLLSGTPTEPGVYTVTATVLDGVQSASRTFTWTVTPASVNTAPTLSAVVNQSTKVGLYDTLQLGGADANGDVLTYSATGLPPGLSINGATGFISGTPTTIGNYAVTARVSDGQASRTRTFTWMIKKRSGL